MLSWYDSRGGVKSLTCGFDALPSLIDMFEKTKTQYKLSDRLGYINGDILSIKDLEYQLGESDSFGN
jgi:hypothetical protein